MLVVWFLARRSDWATHCGGVALRLRNIDHTTRIQLFTITITAPTKYPPSSTHISIVSNKLQEASRGTAARPARTGAHIPTAKEGV